MRLILAFLTFQLVSGASAQITPGFPPYNPDSDFNGIIGTDDLLSLLSIFGEQFDAYNTIVSDDSTFAAVFLGPTTWPECQYSCDTLQGNWSIMDDKSIVHLGDSLFQNIEESWHAPSSNAFFYTSSSSIRYYPSENSSYVNLYHPEVPSWNKQCVCVSRSSPSIEYDFVLTHTGEFSSMVIEKLSQGWNLLGGSTIAAIGYTVYRGQAFWRWAD